MERKITVYCHEGCGLQELTDEQYMKKLMEADMLWSCPKCNGSATWQDMQYKCPHCSKFSEFDGDGLCSHCITCMICGGTGKAEDSEDGECPMCPSDEWLASPDGIAWLLSIREARQPAPGDGGEGVA